MITNKLISRLELQTDGSGIFKVSITRGVTISNSTISADELSKIFNDLLVQSNKQSDAYPASDTGLEIGYDKLIPKGNGKLHFTRDLHKTKTTDDLSE